MNIKQLIESFGLKQKDNMTVTMVMSVTGDTVNNVTLSFEGAAAEGELVMKTFETYDGIMESSKKMARMAGFPASASDLVETTPQSVASNSGDGQVQR